MRLAVEHSGWAITAYRQAHIPPFAKAVAIARRVNGNVQHSWNVEGNSPEDAIRRAIARIDMGGPR